MEVHFCFPNLEDKQKLWEYSVLLRLVAMCAKFSDVYSLWIKPKMEELLPLSIC